MKEEHRLPGITSNDVRNTATYLGALYMLTILSDGLLLAVQPIRKHKHSIVLYDKRKGKRNLFRTKAADDRMHVFVATEEICRRNNKVRALQYCLFLSPQCIFKQKTRGFTVPPIPRRLKVCFKNRYFRLHGKDACIAISLRMGHILALGNRGISQHLR